LRDFIDWGNVRIGRESKATMDFRDLQRIEADVLIIGGGSAGMRAAIEAKKHGLEVVLVSESKVGFKNNSAISKAIFAATGIWKGSGDSPERHVEDTVESGRFINDRDIVSTMAQEARQQFYDLKEFGAKYHEKDGEPLVAAVPGHKYPRHSLFEGRRGISFTVPMRKYASNRGIRFHEGVLVTKLLRHGNRVVGALGVDRAGHCAVFHAKATVLASGGAGGIYLRTNNAVGISGDGYALAYEAGAVLGNMEFVQFYPTAQCSTGRRMVMYEPLVFKGLMIRNSLGEDVLEKYDMKDKTRITRDVLARVMMIEIFEGRGFDGCLLMGIEEKQDTPAGKSPIKGKKSTNEGPEEQLVAPTTHFFMGGVKINEKSETGIEGLYAAGEVCCGVHGANRLAGNAITETFVFGTIAGNQAAAEAEKKNNLHVPEKEVSNELKRLHKLVSHEGQDSLDDLEVRLRRTMWEKVSIIRDRENLESALSEIHDLREQTRTMQVSGTGGLIQTVKMRNMLTVSEMICRAALTRTESRGAHYRSDFPEEDNEHWLKTIEIIQQNGEVRVRPVPIRT
jgi:succinate dehydrogenase/fumarate reductase flavoprotein subunit